jgi:hypothetical protein
LIDTSEVVPYWSAKSGMTSEEDASGVVVVVVVVVEAVVVRVRVMLAATTHCQLFTVNYR